MQFLYERESVGIDQNIAVDISIELDFILSLRSYQHISHNWNSVSIYLRNRQYENTQILARQHNIGRVRKYNWMHFEMSLEKLKVEECIVCFQ